MTRLGDRIRALIAGQGPLSVHDFMAQCLFDPTDGYYTTREPFGTGGDFVTAPEVSQMFGELIGAWLVHAWQAAGSPAPVTLAEIGPGRGTLMKDVLRTVGQLSPKLMRAATVALIEISPRLRAVQQATLGASGVDPQWHETIDTLPDHPLLIVGNELFDAVPMRQYVRTSQGWRERAVSLDDDGRLVFVAGAGSLDQALLPPGAENAPEGAIFEIAPGRSALMDAIASRIAACGGAGLFIDYGYLEPSLGDTFQALHAHRYEDVLDNPGAADLTSHVDFAALAAIVRAKGLFPHLTTQGAFLLQLGLLERAGSLGSRADETGREAIRAAVERLASDDAMGSLFKVLAVVPERLTPAGFPQVAPARPTTSP